MGRYSKRYIGETEEEIIDKETGEIRKRKVRVWSHQEPVDKNFIKFFDTFVMDLLQDDEISGKAIRLLFYIASILDYDEEIFYLSPSEVSKVLDVHRVTIQKWIKILLKKGLILKTNRRNWYMVNRKCIYKGSVVRADINDIERKKEEI